MKILKQKILISFLLLLVVNVGFSQENLPLPSLDKRVTDLTSTLSSVEILGLENKLAKFEEAKGSQVVILILPTTDPEAIEQYGIRLAEKWKIGRTKVDDGVILIIAKDDRKLRIEVGYGLEGAIPDIYAKRIIENIILPSFRSGDFYSGISEGVDAVIGLINKEELPEVTTVSSSEGENTGLSFLVIIGIIIGMIAKTAIKSKKIKFAIVTVVSLIAGFFASSIVMGIIAFAFIGVFFMSSSSGGGGGRGYYGGGHSSGGSFSGGGFSGGGGGFGGGGASGGW